MKLLKIKDNEKSKKDRFSDIAKLTDRIADKTLDQLEREDVFVFPKIVAEAEDLDGKQMILRSENNDFCSGNVMGFVGLGDEQLVIESRFCGSGEDYFLQYLLKKVIDLPNIVEFETSADDDNKLFNFLLFLFPHYLKQAVRKGLFKKYIRNFYNDANVKGTIDVFRHIKQNVPFVGNIAYSCREFSYDNSLTELVRHTIEFIKAKPYGSKILRKAQDAVNLIVDATPKYAPCNRQKIVAENQKNTVRHAYFKEYIALQRLCILILGQHKHQIGFGSRKIYGILFDGALLWEEYVASMLDVNFYHPRNNRRDGEQHLFGGNNGRIYPDFLSKNSENRSVADAKYKPKKNIHNRDYLQILAYMYRFDAKTGYFLYPESKGEDDMTLHMNRGSRFENNVVPRADVVVEKHGFKIPTDAASYEDFSAKMVESENQFKSYFMIEK